MRTKWLFCCMVLILTACQGLGAKPFPAEYQSKVDLGKFQLELSCKGTGDVTILLENDLKMSGEDFSWDANAPSRYQMITRTCTYHRYTPGGSGEKAAGPRTTLDQVTDLHNLLQKAGVPGPYIFVGYGFGGWNLLMYTRQYPQEVAGLVCVSCMPAGLYQAISGKPAAGGTVVPESVKTDMADWKAWFEDWTANEEYLDAPASSEQVGKITDLGNRPFVVLDPALSEALQKEAGTVAIANLWNSLSQEECKLSSHCRFALVPDDPDRDFLTIPEVDLAVLEVYRAVKAK